MTRLSSIKTTFLALFLTVVLFFIATSGMAAEAAEKTYVWADITISYTMIMSWLLVPLAWVVTEYVPVPDDSRPMIPVVFGVIAATVGHMVFNIDVVTVQMQFAAALAAATVA